MEGGFGTGCCLGGWGVIEIGKEGKGPTPIAPIANRDNFLGKDLRPIVATWNSF